MRLADLPVREIRHLIDEKIVRHKRTYGSYEQEKRLWVARHPDSTPEQYQVAMSRLARKCGV